VGIFGVAAVDDVKEGGLHFFCDGAAAAGADLDAVEFADGRDFGGGAGEEGFVGDVDLVAGDAFLHDLQAQVFGDVEHGVAGDAVEGASRQVWRVNDAIFDDEDIFACAFGDKACAVEQQGFVVAVVGGFHIGQNGVGVVADGFGLRHGDVDVVAGVAAGFDTNAALHAFFAEVGAPGPGGNHEVDRVAFGADAELFVANPGQGAQVAGLQLVVAHDGALRFVDLLLREGDGHAQDFGAVEQALGVLLQAEDGGAFVGFVGAHAFEGAAAVVQRVAEHVDFGVAPVHHLAVHPDFAVAVGHGGDHCCHEFLPSFGVRFKPLILRWQSGQRQRRLVP